MSDFMLITSRKQFQAEAKRAWADYSPGLQMQGFINPPYEMPCLAAMFVANGAVSAVVAGKKSAKRLIYPKTNRHRRGLRWFDWVDGDLDEELRVYINVVLDKHKVDKMDLVQAAYIDELMRKVKGKKGPVLISTRLYSFGNKTVVNFFLMTKELASSLVYYNKNYNKGEAAIIDGAQVQPVVPNTLPEGPPVDQHIIPGNFPFIIHIDVEGTVYITTRSIFNTQTNIPRFSDHKETEIARWEAACIKDINVILKNSQADTDGTITIAKVKCKVFLARRRLMRIRCATKYNEDWINKRKAGPGMRELVRRYDQHIHNSYNGRYSKWDQHSG